MAIINPENYFYACNGAVLKDLNETLSEIKNMSPEHFSYHVNAEKNDFSNWIKDIFNDEKLAKKLMAAGDKDKVVSILEKSLAPKKKPSKARKRDVISSIKKRISDGE